MAAFSTISPSRKASWLTPPDLDPFKEVCRKVQKIVRSQGAIFVQNLRICSDIPLQPRSCVGGLCGGAVFIHGDDYPKIMGVSGLQ